MKTRTWTALAAVALALSTPVAAHAAPWFTDATARLGSPQPCFDAAHPAQEGCYTHYVALADLDGDHALDIVFAGGGGYYVKGAAAPLLVYLNDGAGNFTYVNASSFGGYTSRTRQIAIGDIDGDGDLDIFVPGGYGDQKDALFRNDGGGVFTDVADAQIGTTSRAGATRFADVDGDGFLDLIVTDWGTHPPSSPGTGHVYINDGTGSFTEKPGALPMDTSDVGTGPIDVDAVDVDGDFCLDLVIASRVGNSLLFKNHCDGTFERVTDFPHQPGPYVYGPDACDVDGDGDLDVILDNGLAAGSIQLLINDGKGHFTDETKDRVKGNVGMDDNKVQCVDIDGDGDFDLVVAALQGSVERVFINDGTGHFTLDDGVFPGLSDSTLGLDMGDLDGDGKLDAVTAQGETPPFLNRLYHGDAEGLRDTLPPKFRAFTRLTAPKRGAWIHFAISDQTTTDTGPRLGEAHLELNGESVSLTFLGGDLFGARVDVAAGDAYRGCATDWAGNAACSELVTVPPDADPTTEASDDGGCGCAVPGAARGPSVLLALALALALRLRRRPTRRDHADRM